MIMMKPKQTSQGLIDLLERNNIKPTLDSKKDIKLARELLKELNKC